MEACIKENTLTESREFLAILTPKSDKVMEKIRMGEK
jgi:hypothetical protein